MSEVDSTSKQNRGGGGFIEPTILSVGPIAPRRIPETTSAGSVIFWDRPGYRGDTPETILALVLAEIERTMTGDHDLELAWRKAKEALFWLDQARRHAEAREVLVPHG